MKQQLLARAAGEPDAEGQFPEGSVNARVVERLRVIAEMINDDDPSQGYVEK